MFLLFKMHPSHQLICGFYLSCQPLHHHLIFPLHGLLAEVAVGSALLAGCLENAALLAALGSAPLAPLVLAQEAPAAGSALPAGLAGLAEAVSLCPCTGSTACCPGCCPCWSCGCSAFPCTRSCCCCLVLQKLLPGSCPCTRSCCCWVCPACWPGPACCSCCPDCCPTACCAGDCCPCWSCGCCWVCPACWPGWSLPLP